jgi:hypothetical protein
MYIGLQIKYPLFLLGFNKTSIFSKDFRKKTLKYQTSQKSVQWEPRCSMRTDSRRLEHMTKLTVDLRNFSNAPKKIHRSIPLISVTYNGTGYDIGDSRHVVPCCCPSHVPTMHIHTQQVYNGAGVV